MLFLYILLIMSNLLYFCASSQATAHSHTRPLAPSKTSSAKSLMDIGTRRIFNEDHDLFRQSVRRFFQDEVVPHHKE